MNSESGKTQTIYCHGLPGSGSEIDFLLAQNIELPRTCGPQDMATLELRPNATQNQTVHVIGFSLGAMAAIKIAGHYQSQVHKLTLISPAAPLELGHFLPDMAGKLVFDSAKRSAWQFRALTFLQHLTVKISATAAIKAMFADSPPPEQALLADKGFTSALIDGLKQSYGENRPAYCQAVLDYVRPWQQYLEALNCPVEIHHGTADNWAPVEMAYALQKHINMEVELVEHAGLGHYSTLRVALPDILASSTKLNTK